MSDAETKINNSGTEILIQAIDAQVLDANYAGATTKFNDGFSNTARPLDNAVKFIRKSKDAIYALVKNEVFAITQAYASALNEIPNKPDEFSIELLFSISTKGELCIVSAEAQSTMKVTMKWKT